MKKIVKVCECEPWFMMTNTAGSQGVDKSVCGQYGYQCIREGLSGYKDDLTDRTECDCRNDCEMVHTFSTLQRAPFSTNKEARDTWFREKANSGLLNEYLMDDNNLFSDEMNKNITKLSSRAFSKNQLASKRFKNDIAVLNFFFDTPIITLIKLDLRTNIFDQISAIGGSLGLFTGISVITFVEVIWWGTQFIYALFQSGFNKTRSSNPLFNKIGMNVNNVEKFHQNGPRF